MNVTGNIEAICCEDIGIIFNEKPKILKKSSCGILIKMFNRIFVLTCYNNIKKNKHVQFKLEGVTYECTLEYFSEELDLAMLSIKMDSIPDGLLEYSSFEQYNEVNDLNKQNESKGFYILTPKQKIQVIRSKLNTNKINLNSILVPKTPMLQVTLRSKKYMSMQLEITGSALVYDKNVVGLVCSRDDTSGLINVIPNFVIKRFLTEIRNNGSFEGICGIAADIDKITIDSKNKYDNKKYALEIKDNYNINYNDYEYKNKTVRYNFKNGDIVLEIDNKRLDSNYSVYYDKINMYIPYDTFIMLRYITGNDIILTVIRKNNLKKLTINARPFRSMRYIPITFDRRRIFNFKGNYYCILSEDIIEYSRLKGFMLYEQIKYYYTKKPYNNTGINIYVLFVSVQRTIELNKKKYILINNDNIKIINKINKKKLENYNWEEKISSIKLLTINSATKINLLSNNK